MYKDKDKQRETQRERQRRYRRDANLRRDKQGVTERMGVNLETLGIAAVPNSHGGHKLVAPVPKRGKLIDEQGNARVPDAEFTRLMAQAKPGNIRVSKPGDDDYIPQCKTTRDYMSVFKKR